MQDKMPAKNGIELKNNIYPMQNFVTSQNTAIITKGLHEYEVYKNELRICLLRSIGIISNPKNKVRAIPAGPALETPQAQCLGENRADFAIAFAKPKNVFSYLDKFYKNYVTIEGSFDCEFKLVNEKSNDMFLGINSNKKIMYNPENEQVKLL